MNIMKTNYYYTVDFINEDYVKVSFKNITASDAVSAIQSAVNLFHKNEWICIGLDRQQGFEA